MNNELTLEGRVSLVMKRVYFKMFLALLVTALVAWLTPLTPLADIVQARGGYLVLCIIEVGLVLWISAGLMRMKSSTATLLFFLFAIVNGATLSIIGQVFAPEAIAKTFLITAGTFGAMSVYGYFTNSDLTRFGTFLVFALFGIIIVSLVNIFLKSEPLYWLISGVGVLLFLGLTAWDTQQIKRMAMTLPDATMGHIATLGALSLYLDFINLFLYLLRFFGNRR